MQVKVNTAKPKIQSVDISLSDKEAKLILVLLGNTYPIGTEGELAYNMFVNLRHNLKIPIGEVTILTDTGYNLGKAREFINGDQTMCDKNGIYYYGDQRMLVSYVRGDIIARKNKVSNQYNPTYIREWYPGPVGVVVAFPVNGKMYYGYSKTNMNEGDRFDRREGLKIAIDRALHTNLQPPFEECRQEIKYALQAMHYRAKNYFKYLNK